MTDFSYKIHLYLQGNVTVIDAKAWGLIILNGTITTLLISNKSLFMLNPIPFWISLILIFISIILALLVVYPRLSSGKKGLVFWEDILTRKTEEEYISDVKSINPIREETEFALQNYYLSKILHKKYSYFRISMVIFFIGSVFIILSKLINSFQQFHR